MEIILCIAYLVLFYFLFSRSNFINESRIKTSTLYLFFIVKIIAGILLMLYFKHHYGGGDMFAYFEDAKIIHGAAKENIINYLKLLTGIDGDNPELKPYYAKMINKDVSFDRNIQFVNTSIIRWNALIMLFSFQHFYVHIIFMCGLSFIGLLGFYRVFSTNVTGIKKSLLQICVFLTPSLLMWSSAILKETILIFGMGILTYSIQRLSTSFSVKNFIIAILSFAVILFTKKFIALIVIVPLIIFYCINRFNFKKPVLVFCAAYLTTICLGWVLTSIVAKEMPSEMIIEQQQKSVRQAEGGMYLYGNGHVFIIPNGREGMVTPIVPESLYRINPGSTYKLLTIGNFRHESLVENSPLDTNTYNYYAHISNANHVLTLPMVNESLMSIVKAIPYSLFNAIFYPAFTQADNIPTTLVAVENLFILIFIILCCCFATITKENITLVVLCGTISISLLILFGLTTPVTGTLVRYKSIVFPFLLSAAVLLIDENKLNKKLPFLKQ